MGGKRILILTSSPLCRNPRTLKEAATLGNSGYDVTVFTISGRARDEALDRDILQNTSFKKMALPYFGFHGTLGLGAHAGRIFTSLARRLVPLGIERRSALGVFHRLYRGALRTPADLTIVHTELGLAIGFELLKRGRKVAADFEDWHSQDLLPNARRHRPLRLLQTAERYMLQHASYTSTTSDALAAALHANFGGNKPFIITNSFSLQPVSTPRTAPAIPSLLWFSQTVGPGRGLESFIQAWRQTTEPSRLCLLGEISENYRTSLRDLARDPHKPQIEFIPPCPPSSLPARIAIHDIGLALEETSPPNKNLTISNKILQYLNAGLAIAATRTAGHQEVLTDSPTAGVYIDPRNPTECARAIDELLFDRDSLHAMQSAARVLAETHYCWEHEAPRLLALVERAIAPQ